MLLVKTLVTSLAIHHYGLVGGGSVLRILLLGGGDRQSLTLSVVLINQEMLIFWQFAVIVVLYQCNFFMLTLLFGVLFLPSTLSSSISA
jgi:hypothetical protein